jgi:hypothetical protein
LSGLGWVLGDDDFIHSFRMFQDVSSTISDGKTYGKPTFSG